MTKKTLDMTANRITGFIKRKGASFLAVILVILSCVSLAGCGTKVILTTGFGKDEIFHIADQSCTLPEIMVYLTDIQNQYETVYGSGIWDASLDGVSLEDNVKDTVLARIAQVKTMYLMAQSKGVELSEEETEKVNRCAQDYYGSLSESQIEFLGVTPEMLTQMYREYALSELVIDKMIEEANPEISDDEARTVTLQHIFISTGVTDGSGNFVSYDTEEKKRRYDIACLVRDRAANGEDFDELAAEYSEEENTYLSVRRNTMDAAIESAAFELETGQISDVITNESGYHILKCISPLDREQTESNKIAIIEERRQKAFEDEYNNFISGLIKNLNEELWDTVTLPRDQRIEAGFFKIYDENFGQTSTEETDNNTGENE